MWHIHFDTMQRKIRYVLIKSYKLHVTKTEPLFREIMDMFQFCGIKNGFYPTIKCDTIHKIHMLDVIYPSVKSHR